MEAKYKVGDKVKIDGSDEAAIIESVEFGYRLRYASGNIGGAIWADEELKPHVRPLQVGERVITDDGMTGVVCYVHADEACFIADDDKALWIDDLDNLQRVSEESA